jgi:uncharacterized membrane protein
MVFPAIRIYQKKVELPSLWIIGLLIVTTVLYTYSAIFTYKSYQSGPISIITIINQIEVPIVVLFGVVVFREKDNIINKILATVLMIIGAYLLRI